MRKRVLFTASTFSHIVNFHLPYLRAFRALGWEVHVACGGSPVPLPEADRVIALPLEKKMTSPANFRAQAQLRQLMRQTRYDLITTHTSLAAFFTRRAAAEVHPRPPVVNVAHGYLFTKDTPPLKRIVLQWAERLTAGQTDLLLTINRWDDDFARTYHLGREIACIPGIGIDFSALDAPSSRELRATYGFTPKDFVMVYAAEFSARKNQALLIRSLCRLPERVKLLLPGRGALLESCQALAQSLGVAHRVVFPGQVSPMAPLYRIADAAVTASRSEGLPFNVMEAMYAGLPVIASSVKGHTDLLTDGLTGLLYQCETDFCRQIERLLAEPDFAIQLGRAAHEAVLPYALERVLPIVMNHYLAAAHAAPAEPDEKRILE